MLLFNNKLLVLHASEKRGLPVVLLKFLLFAPCNHPLQHPDRWLVSCLLPSEA